MIHFVALPLVAALFVALVGGAWLDRLHPTKAARYSAVLLVAIMVAAFPTLWLIGISGLAHMGFHNPVTDWCHHLLPDYPPLGAIVGGTSLVVATVGTVRIAQVIHRHRRIRWSGTSAFELFDTDEVFAYTVPGPAATIAVSRGLRDTVDDAEFGVVVAHEQSHAEHRHDRYLLLALIATAFLPPVRGLANRMEFFVERWADEDAVRRTGTERIVAARAIAKVALSSTTAHRHALGISKRGVAARADALLVPEVRPLRSNQLMASLVVAAGVVFSGSQIHYSMEFARALI